MAAYGELWMRFDGGQARCLAAPPGFPTRGCAR